MATGMTPAEALKTLWGHGASVGLDGPNIRVKLPPTSVSRADVEMAVETLRHRKQEAVRILTNSKEDASGQTSEEGRRYVSLHARLFPFLGRKVRTPAGPGTLLQVFLNRATVLLDSELSKCRSFPPDEVEPVGGT